jgi:serine/threonine protein kinase
MIALNPGRKRLVVKDYILEEKLGSGMFSTVFRCRDKNTMREYACKKFVRAKMSPVTHQNLEEEIKVL